MTGTTGRRSRRPAIAAVLIAALVFTLPQAPVRAAVQQEPAPADLTVEEAITKARATGDSVTATRATSETDTLVAHDDGTVTLTRTAVPVRKRVDGTWRDLDPTLVRNPDGTLSPAVSTAQLTLSGGGSGPIATMSNAGLSAGIMPPGSLPAPTVSGDTATYASVLPDVDLKVTARAGGGFSEVFVVHTEEAANDPALATLRLPTRLTGLELAADEAGNLVGKDRTGGTQLTAPAPVMWDSTEPPPVARSSATAVSTFRGPGAGARVAPMQAAVRGGAIELVPDRKLLSGPTANYPVYLDPKFTWASSGAKNSGWATLPEEFPGTNYWKDTPDPLGRMQVGNPDDEITSRTFVNFPIATSTLSGATIHTATMKITQTRSYSCTPSRVNLYAPDTTLNAGNATWNYWRNRSLGPLVDYQNAAHGYSGCPAAAIAFDVRSAITADVAAGRKTQTFALVAADMNADNGWKEFLQTSPTMEITYNHKPNRPAGLSTSPGTSCTAATPTVVGDGDVVLYAPVSDRNGSVLGTTFNLYKESQPGTLLASSDPARLTYRSGTTAVLRVPRKTLKDAAGSSVTTFAWRARVTDFNLAGDWSVTCRFRFDPTRTGPPVITRPDEGTTTIGSSTTITVAPPPTGTVPSRYLYQVNGGPHGVVTTTDGTATIAVTPNRLTNTLTVTGLSAGGNVGQTAAATFNADPAERAADGDLDGDAIADLVTTGGQHNVAPGLWLASGEGAGKLAPAAVNLGARGIGQYGTGLPADFDGAQVTVGRFTGTGLQDTFVYYPVGVRAGQAVILRGNGDGSTIQAQLDGTAIDLMAGTFWDSLNGLDPLQLVNAGHAEGNDFPDLLGITGSQATGYYLNHYPNGGSLGGYMYANSLTEQTTPTGGLDWNTWTLASAQTAGGTTVFLWQRATGKLYAWKGLTYDGGTGTLRFEQQQLSGAWNAGRAVTPFAADIDGNGSADLWAVGAGAATAATLVGEDGTLTGAANQQVLTSTHAWMLNDGGEGTVTARDTTGSLPVTGSGSAAWGTGELFDPSIRLGGADTEPVNGQLATTGPALTPTGDFSVSAWVKLERATGTLLSQDGANVSSFRVYVGETDASWRFAMAGSDVTSPAWTIASARANSVTPGVWTHLSASYKRSTGVMDLHINGKDAATATHLTPLGSMGRFRIGAHGATSGVGGGGHFRGQVAEVQAYGQVVIYDDGNPHVRDFDGDLKSDILVSDTNGQLLLYRGNGAGYFRPGQPVIGTGWNNANLLFSPGDLDGDGNMDVIRRENNNSELKLYRGNGVGYWLNGNRPETVGTSMSGYNMFFSPGDFNGDGKADMFARRASTGEMMMFRGNGSGYWQNGGSPDVVAVGWGMYTMMWSPGDFNRDGNADVMGRRANGEVYLYFGNGAGKWLNGSNPALVATGWNMYDVIFSPGDFNGDGRSDVVGRKPNGDLMLYHGDGAQYWLNGNSPVRIGTRWTNFTKVM